MTAVVLRADARSLPLPDASVDLVVTSPPYWALRSYRDAGEHYDGQIGSEKTPAEYIAALLACTREWMRVLKPEGSLFVNLGDKYGPAKSLLSLPWRYALGCTDALGLILRRDIIWSKPNGMPESVTDRCRSSHEYVFHLVKQSWYYAAVDEIREPHAAKSIYQRDAARANPNGHKARRASAHENRAQSGMAAGLRELNPLGKLPGSVWEIAGQPLTAPDWLDIEHFAAFPMELPRRIILGWSPPGGVVADPFGGTGTTALVAGMLGRTGYSFDLSADYCRLATWRTRDPGERAKALQVTKPPPVPDGQGSLFDGLGEVA